ncbi:MAG: hypothetical protein DRJ42_04220 [Deltaproteobacteria bacterium]|nr:MAG: hypothetical protein DRJ42_04220 [Deltaproteobacteria bacterium]
MIVNPRIASVPVFISCLLLTGALSPLSASAQEASATVTGESQPQEAPAAEGDSALRTQFRLGAQANLVIPIGDYASIASVALGADIRLAWDLHENVGITARTGYLHHFGTPGDITLGFIPIMVGGEYRFFGDGSTPFVAAELGTTIGIAAGGGNSNTEVSFGLGIGGGYRLGPVDIKAMFYTPDIDDLVSFSITVGGDFASF